MPELKDKQPTHYRRVCAGIIKKENEEVPETEEKPLNYICKGEPDLD